jgi:hypothetical protein
MHPQMHPLLIHFVFVLHKMHPQTHPQVHPQYEKSGISDRSNR